MAETKIFKKDGVVTAITEGAPAVIETSAITGKSSAREKSNSGTPSPDAKTTKELLDPERNNRDWIEWGDDDDFPNKLMETLGKLGVGKAALESNADLHYGQGIRWFYEKLTDEGKIVSVPVKVDDFTRLVRDQNYEIEHSEAVDSLEYFYIAFVQFMWDAGKKRINWIKTLNTPFCRFLKQDASGNIPGIRYSAKFPDAPTDQKDYQDIMLFDPKNPQKHATFVLPVFYGTWGRIFYPEPDYFTVFRNKWVSIATTVPLLIDSMYSNFATLKYHIKIPGTYFLEKYKDWDQKTEKEQLEIFKKEQIEMNSFLTKPENSGKAFITIYGVGADGKEIPGWVIEPIKNYLEATAELPNNQAANYEILYAMNQDPTMQGLDSNGSGSNLAGSGSNKRQSRQNKLANMKRARLYSLQIPKLIAQLNGYYSIAGYGPDLYPDYVSTDTSQTLDENPTGSQTVK